MSDPAATPRAALIVNPVKARAERTVELVHEAAKRHGYAETLVIETTVDDPGSKQAQEALDAGVSLVIACGGDGTVRMVSERLVNTGIPLGIVAAGTGNLLARNLALNPDVLGLEALIDIAFTGRERNIDTGVAEVERPNGKRERHAFAVLAGIGVDAAMIDNTDEELKARIGWLAYVGGVAKSINGRDDVFRARLRLDRGHTLGTRAAGIMVGNCGRLQAGMVLLPDAVIDDGRLDLLLLRPSRGPFGWLQVLSSMVSRSVFHRIGRFGQRINQIGERHIRTLDYLQGSDIVLRLDTGPQNFEMDGDALGQIRAARVQVLPSALTVRVAEHPTLVS